MFQPAGEMHGDACVGDVDCVIVLSQSGAADFIPRQWSERGGKLAARARRDRSSRLRSRARRRLGGAENPPCRAGFMWIISKHTLRQGNRIWDFSLGWRFGNSNYGWSGFSMACGCGYTRPTLN